MLFTILVISVLVAVDQFTKYWATVALAPNGTAPFLPGIMELRYVLNDGAAFSILGGKEWGRVFLIVLTSIAMLVILYLLFFRRGSMNRLCYASLLLIEAGGIGNLIDRVLNGYVVDFFATTFINFAIFNVADCFISVGFAFLVLYYILEERKHRRAAAADTKSPAPQQQDEGTEPENGK